MQKDQDMNDDFIEEDYIMKDSKQYQTRSFDAAQPIEYSVNSSRTRTPMKYKAAPKKAPISNQRNQMVKVG